MRYRVLGPLEVRRGTLPVAVGGPQQRELLALLLLNANRAVSVEWLVEQLWGADPPATARSLLHGCVADLRRALRTEDGGVAGQPLLTRPPGYLLQVHPGELDVDRVDELAATATRAAAAGTRAALEESAAQLTEALALWRGPVLAGITAAAGTAEATRLQERFLTLLERRADIGLRLGRFAELTGELRARVGADPLREPLWGRLILALYGTGRQAEALAAYQEVRRILVEQLGIEPGAGLQRLERDILARTDPAELVRREAGEPAADADPAAPQAGTGGVTVAVPAQLPAAVRPFVGRDGPFAELDALTGGEAGAPGSTVVISAIDGTAGVGKTALAVHWAHRVAGRFGDGQLYLDLRGYAGTPAVRPIEALAGFLQALGVPAEQVPLEVEQAAGLYRTLLAGKRVLVLLDNARSAEQVRPLLPGSAGCLVLVTSRDRLGGLIARDGARHLTLDVLTAGEATDLLVGVLGRARVEAEPAAAGELAQRCAHLPLALRIAAADLALNPRRSIAGQAARLAGDDRLSTLQVDGDEQAAVRAAFELSYAAQPDRARRMFRLLGLVAGPDVTADAAAALADTTPDQAASQLDRLAVANLLARPDPDRYTCHDLLRRYAAERAQAEEPTAERDAAGRRLNDWYLHTVDAAAQLLYPEMVRLPPPPASPRTATPPAPPGFADRPAAVRWLDAELANLVAAAERAAAHGPGAFAVRMADALRGYFWSRVQPVRWLAVADLGRAAAEADGDLPGQAAAELSAADAHLMLAKYPPAAEHYARAADLAERAGWLPAQASALGNLGMVFRELGRLPEAAEHLGRALAIDRQTGAVGGQAARLGNLANVALELGRLALATEYLSQTMALFRTAGSPGGEATALANLGLVYIELGEPEQAHESASRALELLQQIGNRNQAADALCVLAQAHRDAGRPDEALAVARAALALARENGDRRFEPDGRSALASIQHRLGQHEEAIEEYLRVLQRARETAAGYTETAALIGLAEAHRSLGRLDDAGQHAERALALAQRSGYRSLEGQARTALAAVHRALGQPEQARAEARRALELHRATGHRPGERRTRRLLAGLPGDPGTEVGTEVGAEIDAEVGAAAGPGARRPAVDAGPLP